jgi:DNA modification methylase
MLEINKIYNMDCIEGIKLIDDNSVDLIVTDPPYFIENLKTNLKESTLRKSSKNNIFFNEFDHFKDLNEFKLFIENVLKEFERVLKPMKQCYMFVSYHHLDWVIGLIKSLNFRYYKPLIWYKPDTMGVFPNQYGCNYEVILWFRKKGSGDYVNNIGCSQRDVFNIISTKNSDRKDAGYHPTPKPKKLKRQSLVFNPRGWTLAQWLGTRLAVKKPQPVLLGP